MAEIIQVQNKGIKDRGDGDLLNKINHNNFRKTVEPYRQNACP